MCPSTPRHDISLQECFLHVKPFYWTFCKCSFACMKCQVRYLLYNRPDTGQQTRAGDFFFCAIVVSFSVDCGVSWFRFLPLQQLTLLVHCCAGVGRQTSDMQRRVMCIQDEERGGMETMRPPDPLLATHTSARGCGGGATRAQMDAPGSFLGLTPRPLFSRFIDFQLASWSCMIDIERLPRASR